MAAIYRADGAAKNPMLSLNPIKRCYFERPLFFNGDVMTISGMLQLAASTLVFLLAAVGAKHWAISPTFPKLAITLILYTIGNLIMLRLVREFGMASAFTLSALLQLVAINAIAIAYFGEKLPTTQLAGIMLAIIAVGLITFAPSE